MPIDIETPLVISAVHAKARNLKTHPCFWDKDSEDIAADLFVHLWETGLTLSPERLVDTSFIHMMLNRKGVDMLRHQMSKKELTRHHTKSLDTITGEDEDGNLQTMADILSTHAPSVVDEVAFRIDFSERFSALPNDLRAIAGKMLQGRNHADIAREMKLSRDAFHRRYATLIQKIIFPEWYAKIKMTRPVPKTSKVRSQHAPNANSPVQLG